MSGGLDESDVRRQLTAAFDRTALVPAWLDEKRRTGPQTERLLWQERADELEAHIRLFVVDKVLKALGWAIEPATDELGGLVQNLSVEVPLRPRQERHRKRLDYFGFDAVDRRPLLVVETKGPSLEIDCAGCHVHPSEHPWVPRILAACREQTNARRRSTNMPPQWTEAVCQLADYVRRIAGQGAPPQRAVLTNGSWFVVFTRPEQTFVVPLEPERPPGGGSAIQVFEDPGAVLANLRTFRNLLDYRTATAGVAAISVAQARGYIDPRGITGVVWGLRVFRPRMRSRITVECHGLRSSPLLVLVGADPPGTRGPWFGPVPGVSLSRGGGSCGSLGACGS